MIDSFIICSDGYWSMSVSKFIKIVIGNIIWCIFTTQSSYTSAVLGIVILSCPSHACFVTKRKKILPIFWYHGIQRVSDSFIICSDVYWSMSVSKIIKIVIGNIIWCIFTTQSSYAGAVLGIVILSCPSHACFVTKRKKILPIFWYHSIQRVSDVMTRLHLRLAATSQLIVLATRCSTLGDRAFPVAAARAWNALPHSSVVCTVTSNLQTIFEHTLILLEFYS